MSKDELIIKSFFQELEKAGEAKAGVGDVLKKKFNDWLEVQKQKFRKKINPNKDVPVPLPKPGEKTAQVDTSNAQYLTTNEYPDWVQQALTTGIVKTDDKGNAIGTISPKDLTKFIEKNPPVDVTTNQPAIPTDTGVKEYWEGKKSPQLTKEQLKKHWDDQKTEQMSKEELKSYWDSKSVKADEGVSEYWSSKQSGGVTNPQNRPAWINEALETGIDVTDADGKVTGQMSADDIKKFIDKNPGSDKDGNVLPGKGAKTMHEGRKFTYDKDKEVWSGGSKDDAVPMPDKPVVPSYSWINKNIKGDLGREGRENNTFKNLRVKKKNKIEYA